MSNLVILARSPVIPAPQPRHSRTTTRHSGPSFVIPANVGIHKCQYPVMSATISNRFFLNSTCETVGVYPMIKYRLVSHYLATLIFLWLMGLSQTFAGEFPLFDAHVHYQEDIWQGIPPDDAIQRLKKQGIQRAIVSSTPADGAIKLFKQNPELVIPFLRPYRSPADRRDWYKNPDILKYVRSQLDSFDYQGLGEFHLFDSQVKTPAMQEILALARKNNLILLAHSDHETIDALLTAAPNQTLIWAHGGFDIDVNIVAKKLKLNRNLYIELSFREGITEQGLLVPEWRELLMTYPSRFLIGTDTYTGQRWLALPELTDHYQGWLKQLPRNVAEAIAYKNGERIAAQKPVRNE